MSFDKGCYVGQELIARTHHKGEVRKRLLPFYLSSINTANPSNISNVNSLSVSLPERDGRPAVNIPYPFLNTSFSTNNEFSFDSTIINYLEDKDEVGKIKGVVSNSNVGVALLRLNKVDLKEIDLRVKDVKENEYKLIPFFPSWWNV